MNTYHLPLGDKIKQEMAVFRAEIKQDLEGLRQDTKADIASLKMDFRAETSSFHWTQAEMATAVQEIEGMLNCHESSIIEMENTISELKQAIRMGMMT